MAGDLITIKTHAGVYYSAPLSSVDIIDGVMVCVVWTYRHGLRRYLNQTATIPPGIISRIEYH